MLATLPRMAAREYTDAVSTLTNGIRLAAMSCLILTTPGLGQSNWIKQKPVSSPTARGGHAMAYDSARQRTVLFGGFNQSAETWEWDGKNWLKIPTTSGPSARFEHAMVYDSARRRTVLFGGWTVGMSNETWEWDGKVWTKMSPKHSPPIRAAHAMAYDVARRRTVLFGGHSSYNDTWEWDGKDWIEFKRATKPWPRSLHAMAYDSKRQRTVLFGGRGITDKITWEWDGKVWTPIKPLVSPPFRANHAMVYDEWRQRVVVHAGSTTGQVGGSISGTWEWDGREWTKIQTANSPVRLHWHAMVYDSARRRTMMFGGYTPYYLLADTWEYGGLRRTLLADTYKISNAAGGAQNLTLRAGYEHANKAYWIVGSSTGTSPGITLDNVRIPLNPDPYTDLTIIHANSINFRSYRGILDANGKGTAAFYIAKGSLPSAVGITVHHAYLVFDARGVLMASNPLPVTLEK